MVARPLGKKHCGVIWYEASVWVEKILEADMGYGCTTLRMYLKKKRTVYVE